MTLPSVLSPVSHLFYKCIGLRPYPYLISPIRTSPITEGAFFVYVGQGLAPAAKRVRFFVYVGQGLAPAAKRMRFW